MKPGHGVVLKTYPNRAKLSYDSEYQTYASLRNGNRECDYILKCLGTFRYASGPRPGEYAYSIVLEYADRGSLLDFYHSIRQPRTPQDKEQFWKSLIMFLVGLEKMHAENAGEHGT